MTRSSWLAPLGFVLVACNPVDDDPGDVTADTDTQGLFTDVDTDEPTVPDTDDPTDTDTPGTTDTSAPTGDCYPAGAVEPMAVGEVLTAYSWPEAIHRGTEERLDIDLAQVPCAGDPDIDWSPHDVLVFVSIPAW